MWWLVKRRNGPSALPLRRQFCSRNGRCEHTTFEMNDAVASSYRGRAMCHDDNRQATPQIVEDVKQSSLSICIKC